MRKLLLAMTAGASLFSTAATADSTILFTSRFWQTFGGTTTTPYVSPMCGIMTTWGKDNDKRVFILKWIAASPTLVVHIAKSSWKIPAGTSVDVVIQLDGESPWSGKATSVGTYLELTVPGGNLRKLLSEIRFASKMTIAFPSGNEPPWVGSMEGSNQAVVTMFECYNRTAQPTQPFATEPTQPFVAPRPVAAPREDRI